MLIKPDKLNLKSSEIKKKIDVGGDCSDWHSIFGTNCYAYALGLDLKEQRICDKAYQIPGLMGSIILHRPIFELRKMSIEDRMILDLEALEIKYKEVEPEEKYDYTFHTYRNSTSVSSITYSWPVAVFESEDDFHFLRKCHDGSWSHKVGFISYPTEMDFDKKIITDPRKCNLEQYKYKKTYLLTLNQKW